jgi:hypothetical protein
MKENDNNFNREFPLWSFKFKPSSKVEAISRKDLEAKLILKALKDKDFKRELLNNGKATVEHFLNIQLPGALTVQVLEETEHDIYLVLPANPYAGIAETEIQQTLGMELEDIADWVLDQQKGIFPEDKENNVRLVTKAWRDDSFKQALLSNPAPVLGQELGEEVDDNISIHVLEETENELFIVIPQLPDSALKKNEIEAQSFKLPLVIGTGTGGGFNNSKYVCPLP